MSNYLDDISGSNLCFIEGCLGKGTCPRCGETDYVWMGYWGAVARWSKEWNLTEEQTQERFYENSLKTT